MDFTPLLNQVQKKRLSCGQPVCWAHNSCFSSIVGVGNVGWIEGLGLRDGLQSFQYSKQCWSSFYMFLRYDRLEIEGYGLVQCRAKFQLIDQGRLTGLAINSNQSGGWLRIIATEAHVGFIITHGERRWRSFLLRKPVSEHLRNPVLRAVDS